MQDFPPMDYGSPRYFKNLFRKIYDGNIDVEKIPKIIIKGIYADKISYFLYCVFYIVIVNLAADDEIWLDIVICYVAIVAAIACWVELTGTIKCFFYKYKKLKRENFLYLWRRIWLMNWRETYNKEDFGGVRKLYEICGVKYIEYK